jgi:uncharacterized protein involved in cysteine biosynthesis
MGREGTTGRDEDWDEQARHETPTERLDRNWGDLLQELRVTQTGVQFLTGFLLTLPFQQKFASLSHDERVVYLVTVAASVLATGFLVFPVSLHRVLFRQHARREMVRSAHRSALAGLALLAVAVVGVVEVVFAVVVGDSEGWIAAGVTAVVLVGLWLVLPLGLRRKIGHDNL